MNIVFMVMCYVKDIIEEDTSIQRHDLLSEFIMNDFNHTNAFGKKIHCVSSREIVVDKDYACRELVFEQSVDADLVKTYDGVPRLVNNTGYYEQNSY